MSKWYLGQVKEGDVRKITNFYLFGTADDQESNLFL